MINARSETLLEKPAFRTALAKHRCIIPADGYYEWQAQGKQKQPFWIHRQDQQAFGFAACGTAIVKLPIKRYSVARSSRAQPPKPWLHFTIVCRHTFR